MTVSGESGFVSVRGLRKSFPIRSAFLKREVGAVQAVAGIDFDIASGQTLGLVGESGSGKSTAGRLVLQLLRSSAGSVEIDGTDVTRLAGRSLRILRRNMQMVFQDPYSSLDPRQTIGESIAEPLRVHEGLNKRDRTARVLELLQAVGLSAVNLNRYPHEFSGGQRQRIAIARAIALEPKFIVCDEPLSSLDVSTQSQVINLLMKLQREHDLTYLFISHDLSVVHHISDRIAVMYLGEIVEQGPADEVCERPTHPYTQALLSASPIPNPKKQRDRNRILLQGEVPSPSTPPSGCRFHTRCTYVMSMCRETVPQQIRTTAGSTVACHLHTAGPTLAGQSVNLLLSEKKVSDYQ